MRLATTDIFKRLNRKGSTALIVLTDTKVKQVQKIELEELKDILDVCCSCKINYHLTGGSALGAVRHKGFVPWDDDLDIDMSRADVNRFLATFREKYGEKYWIHSSDSLGSKCIPYIQLRRKNTVFQGCNDPTADECGIGIDIAVIENTYDNKFMRTVHGCVSLALGMIVSCRKFYMNREYLLQLANGDAEATSVFKTKIRLGFCVSFFSLERWTKMYNMWNSICKNNHSKYVAVPTGRKHFFGETYLRSDFFETTEGTFEEISVKLPSNTDEYLTHMYGDYMKIPPAQDREQHTLVAFVIDCEDGRGGVILRVVLRVKYASNTLALRGAA
ncbi:MAG: LicD family protein [Clostridiales bacterium]|nr:LicD family protein [Clostridiales bacterium]